MRLRLLPRLDRRQHLLRQRGVITIEVMAALDHQLLTRRAGFGTAALGHFLAAVDACLLYTSRCV